MTLKTIKYKQYRVNFNRIYIFSIIFTKEISLYIDFFSISHEVILKWNDLVTVTDISKF